MLTDVQIRKAKPAARAFKLTDGGGLHLYVSPAGGKLWRWRYEYGGKEKLLSIGRYPDIGLSEAREARDAARKVLKAGRDPSIEKKAKRLTLTTSAAETFEALAHEWHKAQLGRWTERHADDVMVCLKRDLFPDLGPLPVRDITTPQVLAVLRKIEARGAPETARRARQRVSGVFAYAIGSGRAEQDPAAVVVKAMVPVRKGRQPAIVDIDEAREILRRCDATPGSAVTKLALRFLALTAVRPGEIRGALWDEILPFGAEPTWLIPAPRMKMKRDHVVPLSTQAVETLRVAHRITGRGPLVFPNSRHAHHPMSENAIGYLMNRAGYHHRHVPHGWRSTFSTVMNDRHRAERHVIDLMLAHSNKDKVEGAYNRAEHLARRRELAQEWADALMEGLAPPGDLVGRPHR